MRKSSFKKSSIQPNKTVRNDAKRKLITVILETCIVEHCFRKWSQKLWKVSEDIDSVSGLDMEIKEEPDITAQLALTLAAGSTSLGLSWPHQTNPIPAPQAHTSMLTASSEAHTQHLTEPPPAHAHVHKHPAPEPFLDKCK